MNVIVHGGAGSTPEDPESRQTVLDEAARTGTATASPVEAVCGAIAVLEESPRFNAGIGGAVQSDGIVRTDAGIMTGRREAGAACSMPSVTHAVDVARAVMEETPHVLLSGVHAVDFAADHGIEVEQDLWSSRTREHWDDLEPPSGGPREQLEWVKDRFGESAEDPDGRDIDGDPKDHDTVGAVASDGEHVAAATSTGGRWLALAGRVGDVPQIGGGFYCTPAGGASATGAGEDIARVTLSRQAVSYLEDGASAQNAADRAIGEFADLTDSTAGVIVCDRAGETGSAYNSELMQTKALTRD
ncbi:isoaspartyl peptidase/L-asparaginase [Halalkalicoccus jeotgali]|uniref:Plant-type L-asparaginase n=1 Tax=Halalkalicoccus jeotgali (strain DSM 18796 / CECT 7217 / JCM 14584 / KCTC 4019 / B3) TaxID=795797 RepID=D8JAH6_HALJB|nr:isoaspartyl peptidase/L-asparaginase family protein [Halalkalicoccus jeotgali]ADJ14698.1 Beta-aspartyl-peptidase [Halalkalicoccus jeotgali B3]ELY39596.1 beta-aspartyl-peptidase [Halalkalicoccus jeotgali B3]